MGDACATASPSLVSTISRAREHLTWYGDRAGLLSVSSCFPYEYAFFILCYVAQREPCIGGDNQSIDMSKTSAKRPESR